MESVVRRTALMAFSLACAITSASCVGPVVPSEDARNPYPPLAVLEAEEASKLEMPGAAKLRRVAGERSIELTGPQAAFVGGVFGTMASSQDVINFYGRELLRLGWRPDRRPTPSTGERDTRGWCKPRLVLRLAVIDPERYQRVGIDPKGFSTVFDVSVVGTTFPCPFQLPSGSG